MWMNWRWLCWNLFLAIIPVVAGWLFAAGLKSVRQNVGNIRQNPAAWPGLIVSALVWFFFLPNTCYLLTEWRHFLFDSGPVSLRQEVAENPILKLVVAEQGLFFVTYSALGVLCYALSIRLVAQALRQNRVSLLPLAAPFYLLMSLGVYMGLIVRLNSWDIVSRPGHVWRVASHALFSPTLLAIIIAFAFLLWALYEIVDIWLDGVEWRLHRAWQRLHPAAPKITE